MAATALTQVIPQRVDYIRILPEIVLSLFGMVIMVLDPLLDERASQKTTGSCGPGWLTGRTGCNRSTWRKYLVLRFWDMVRVDAFSVFFHFVVITVAAVAFSARTNTWQCSASARANITR